MGRIYGRDLAKKWDVPVSHALYHVDGLWYQHLTEFPGGLFDQNGFVIFRTREEYMASPYLRITERVKVPQGISAIPGYTRVVPSKG